MNSQKVIGIVGGGQLGQMLTLAAAPLGFKVVVVDPSDNCPAAQVGAEQIQAPLNDKKALRQLAKKADYITVEIEHLDTRTLEAVATEGTPVNPAPQTIRLIQDKYTQKEFLAKNGFAVAPSQQVDNPEQANKAFKHFDGSMLLKTRHNAYDGRGNALIHDLGELEAALERFKDVPLYAEQVMDFTKELAVMVAKDMDGNVRAYLVTETIHERNICIETLTPAQISSILAAQAVNIATQAVKKLQGAGMYGVELFLLKDDSIVINEIAPRVHNSGHYTMDACVTSQFEQHIRAITGLPLGDVGMVTPVASMINILGQHNRPTELAGLAKALKDRAIHIHLYGKSPTKVDRKMGHINALGDTLDQTRKAAQKARKRIEI
ncbi:MAG: 5-(carboxyamino)imidazole ribonucleotide synthase [Candidatus Saccharimonadales bacterium]